MYCGISRAATPYILTFKNPVLGKLAIWCHMHKSLALNYSTPINMDSHYHNLPVSDENNPIGQVARKQPKSPYIWRWSSLRYGSDAMASADHGIL